MVIYTAMDINLGYGLAFLVIGLFIAGLCLPLRQRKIGKNRWYGFRYPQSYTSDSNWYRINEYGARRLIPWSLIVALTGALALIYAIIAPGSALLCGCIPWIPLVLLIPVLQSWLFARSCETSQPA